MFNDLSSFSTFVYFRTVPRAPPKESVKPFGYADVEAYNNIPDSGSNKYKNTLLLLLVSLIIAGVLICAYA